MTVEAFPVVYSTLACQAVVDRILPCYSITEVRECQFWHRGLSDVYLIETLDHPYILRISQSHWRSKTEIDFELELLSFLKQQYIPVAYPLHTETGELTIEIDAPEGKRYASLFIYAPGKVPIGDLSSTQSQILGETVAKFHQAALNFRAQVYRQPLTLQYLLDDSWTVIEPFLLQRPADLSYLQRAIADLKEHLTSCPQGQPYWGVCWGDPHSGNAHFTAENQITLFDFDQCGYGWRIFDIAKFFQVALNGGISRTIRDAFLEAYQMVQPLSNWELSALQAFTQVAHIWVWAISLTNSKLHNYCRLDNSYFLHRLEQLKMLKSPDWQLF
jgi:Ser/Thr protein kinase RdoA (MazF antagonist)